MTQASVGWHCPNCVAGNARAQAPARKAVQVAMHGHKPLVTQAIMGLCAAVFAWDILQGSNFMTGQGGAASRDLGLFAPFVQNGEWYRVFTSAFTHSGLIHIGFNMYLLWMLGKAMEGRFGSLTFGTIYVAGILGGSLGAVLVEPRALVVGASGAVFALMGATVVLQRAGGMNIFQSGIGGLILINVLLSFRGGISLGGHLGGLIAGAVVGLILSEARKRGRRFEALAPAAVAAFAFVLAIALVPAISRAVSSF